VQRLCGFTAKIEKRFSKGKTEEAVLLYKGPSALTIPLEEMDQVYSGFYRSTREWAAAMDPAAREYAYRRFDLGDPVFLSDPSGQKPNPHPAIPPFRDGSKPTPQFVAILPGGRIVGTDYFDNTHGAVISPDGKLLWDVSVEFTQPDRHSVFSLRALPPLARIPGTTAVLTSSVSDNYYHWMFDVIVRFELLRLAGIEPDRYILNRGVRPFQQETLRTLGIPQEKIMECRQDTHLEAERLVVPSMSGYAMLPSKWACETLRRYFLTGPGIEPAGGYERIYISRSRASNRRVANEHEVAELLKAYGFRFVSLESLPVSRQAAIFAAAQVVVAPHGAGLTNLVFCSPGTKVIELFSPDHSNDCYWYISRQMNLDYRYCIELRAGERTGDVIVNPARLQIMLEKDGLGDPQDTAGSFRRIYSWRETTAASILQRLFQIEDVYAFATEIYREFLHREPDPEGLEYHIARFRQGASKMEMITAILQSEEALQFYHCE